MKLTTLSSNLHNIAKAAVHYRRTAADELSASRTFEELIVVKKEFKSASSCRVFDQIRHRCFSAALCGSPGRDDTPDDPHYDAWKALTSVFGRRSNPDPAGEAHDAPQTL